MGLFIPYVPFALLSHTFFACFPDFEVFKGALITGFGIPHKGLLTFFSWTFDIRFASDLLHD